MTYHKRKRPPTLHEQDVRLSLGDQAVGWTVARQLERAAQRLTRAQELLVHDAGGIAGQVGLCISDAQFFVEGAIEGLRK